MTSLRTRGRVESNFRRFLVRRWLLLAALVAAVPMTSPAVAIAAPAPSRPVPQATVPSGFTDTLVSDQSTTPISITALPDGRAVVLEKHGYVRVIQNGALLPQVALVRTVCQTSERGMLGFAVDPNFLANGYVYIYYTRPNASAPGGCVNRVSRFTMFGNAIFSDSELVLVDNIGSPAGNHNGGSVAIGNDGYLYIAVGDGGCDPRDDSGCGGGNNAAQDLSLLNGKILRVDRASGAPAAGNPFSGAGTAICRTRGNSPSTPTTICREIFAYGLRNPWRFAFDPNTGATKFHINDVGQNTREEVNLGILGANYGWPAREGQCAQGQNPVCPPPAGNLGYTQPITDYPHGTGDYITGGAFVPNGAWSSAYDGGYLYADGNPGRIFFKPAVGNPNPSFATGGDLAGVSDIGFVMEPTGWALYYVSPVNDEIRKITYNTTPAASPGNLAFASVTPSQRVFDSRNAGPLTGVIRAGTSRLINVVPSQGDHRAALVNITMVRPTSTAFVTAWQPRTTKPTASNINVATGKIAANASIVPIDGDGNVLLFVNATSHLIVDVLGFFDVTSGGSAQAGRLVPTDPIRAADTRQPANGTDNQYTRTTDGLDEVVNVPIEGQWGVGTDTSAVALIVTGISANAVSSGYVVVLPHGGTIPSSSNVNTNGGGEVRSNLVIVPVGADGSVDVRLRTTAHVVVDVVGSFTDGTAPNLTDGTFVPLAPTRVVDSRIALGFNRLAATGTGSVNPSVVPNNAMAVAQNIVVVKTGGTGYLTAYPTGLSVPNVSNINANGPNQTRSAMAITGVGTGGSVSYYTSFPTDVVVDVTGYFNPATF
jgi:glucose/arabinose dehydrogenase